MRLLIVLCAVVAALAAAPLATAGGWATVGFAPLPDGTSAGGTWHPDDLRQAARDHAARRA